MGPVALASVGVAPLAAGEGSLYPVAGLLFAVALAAVHVLAGRLSAAAGPRRGWLSAAGGASVAYVFVLLFPEVSEAVLVFEEAGFEREQAVYLVALLGFVAFYGLEVYVAQAREESVEGSDLVFWGHVAVFGAYNLVIGYLLLNQERAGLRNLSFYALAMGLHFLVNDHGLRVHHGAAYDAHGRWLLAGAVLSGAVLGLVAALPPIQVSMLFALVAGGIVLNVLKEELPGAEESRFSAFAAGALLYAVILLLA